MSAHIEEPTELPLEDRQETGRRDTIAVQGARVHNLQDVSVEIPRDRLVVVTGLSGSGKSSLAFDTIFAEGQRRYLASLSAFARRFVGQVKKPDVDFVYGLSPVISIEQKTVGRNPRSTVGTMTEISSYMNLLFSTTGRPRCPWCDAAVSARKPQQILDALFALGEGAKVELRAPIFEIYGEDYDFLFTEIRKRGYRKVIIDGQRTDISDAIEIDASRPHEMEAVIDRLIVRRGAEREILGSLRDALLVGDPWLRALAVDGDEVRPIPGLGCDAHGLCAGPLAPEFFQFNKPASACRTCLGLGTYLRVHPELLVRAPERSLKDGCLASNAFTWNPDNWDGRALYSLSLHYGFDLDTPWQDLPEAIRDILLYGTKGQKVTLKVPPEAKYHRDPERHGGGWVRLLGKGIATQGFASRIERQYKWYRQKQVANSGMEGWLRTLMVEHSCPDCEGSRLRASRRLVRVGGPVDSLVGGSGEGMNIHEMGQLHLIELRDALAALEIPDPTTAPAQIRRELVGRLELLLGIGLDYLSLNRTAGTLSGGESQRIRLSTQIGSGLMGMLYVLDEPSIGLHPKDNARMIATLRRLRDLGNTVIVVEHDEDTIRAADHLVEMGPGPGVHGGRVVAQGALPDLIACPESPTGQFLSGARAIALPDSRRAGRDEALVVRGARENNLQDIDVEIPLGSMVCITGASGSGKSTLVNEILYKSLRNHTEDRRDLCGDCDAVEGMAHVDRVVSIDQSPIGRSPRSNPATYVGFYDSIRKIFAKAPLSVARGYAAGQFSFNVKTGRCPECSGEGVVKTQLYFMPDVEALCESCKGARFSQETLEVTWNGKNIAEVLAMSIEDALAFFQKQRGIRKKLQVLNDLGLGYLTLGQSATTLSGGEAQRVKLADELARLRRGAHTLYILDEPTTGLHLADIERLLDCLNRLVDAGHSVVVIEHQLDVIKVADWVIDLGPEGGHRGGQIVAQGAPEDVAANEASATGAFLRRYLE